VRSGWKQEILECLGRDPRWVILSYNEAAKRAKEFGPGWDLLILDEAHYLKNPDSQRTKAIFANGIGLARKARRVWALTGSPVLNRPVELYPILKTMAADRIHPFTTFALYAHQFCGAFWDGRGLNVRGASNLPELRRRLEGFMLRRVQEEVLSELPDLIVSRVPVALSREAERKIAQFEEEVQNRDALLSPTQEAYGQLGDLATLMRVTGEAKVPAAADYVRGLLETVNKVVVFAHHRDVVHALEAELKEFAPVIYVGGMGDIAKSSAIRLFRSEHCRVFIGNIKAAGTGINGLQDVASDVVFAELSWVPEEMKQAIFRLKRMGQKARRVHAHVLHAPGTLESAVLAVHDGKNAVIDKLLGRVETVGLGGLW
jgi:SNF2 family DNA or RNA helicase